MNINKIVTMITRLFSGNRGTRGAARGSQARGPAPSNVERSQVNKARETAKLARRAAKVTRRLGR